MSAAATSPPFFTSAEVVNQRLADHFPCCGTHEMTVYDCPCLTTRLITCAHCDEFLFLFMEDRDWCEHGEAIYEHGWNGRR